MLHKVRVECKVDDYFIIEAFVITRLVRLTKIYGVPAIFSFSALAAKIILVPLDITHKFLATPEIRQALLFGCNTSYHRETEIQSVSNVRQLFSEILQFFAKTYADIFGFTAGPPTHDPLAVFAAFLPEAFQFHTVGLCLEYGLN